MEGQDSAIGALQVPSGIAIKIDTVSPTLELNRANLKKIPSRSVDTDSKSVLSRRRALRQLRGLEDQYSVNAFYECRDSNPAPSDADCSRIIDEVYALGGQSLIIAPNACLLFQYGTCWGFFCALCQGQQLTTDTDFVAAQLSSAEALCVANGGQVGTIVGDDAPQWQAGFVYRGQSLPDYYDVC
ncbi:hypothetical protein AAE478_006243 [Parahypoxylon ruwenzoriense]